jgi:hypothetical protein
VAVLLLALAACSRGEHRAARVTFDKGVASLVAGKYEDAEKQLLDARSNAGFDSELRFRAAYDLGIAYARHADQAKAGKDADLSKAAQLEGQAVSWFADAARLRKDDADAQANLAIARARAQALSDELDKGAGKLEARLDAVITDQRGVLDGARDAWVAIKQAGGADPLAQQGSLEHLADEERGIVAEAGVIGDLASDEIDAIGKKAEDKRTEQEKARLIQLKNLDLYLMDARTKIAEARRHLQELAAEDGVASAEAALEALKRGREQLLDPITVLRDVAQDELGLMQATRAVAEASAPAGAQASISALVGQGKAAPIIPAWLQPPAMAQRQGGLHDRTDEVHARLQAGADGAAKNPPKKPEEQKLVAHIQAALPFVAAATAAMDHARTALAANHASEAGDAEREALLDLGKAIEQFADLKQTIDLAYDTQQQIVGLLGPDAAKQLSPAERTSETKDDLASNQARMGRIKDLLGEAEQQLAAKEQQLAAKQAQAGAGSAAGSGSGSGSAASSADPKLAAAQQAIAAEKERFTKADGLRDEADKALADMAAAVAAGKDPTAPAKLAADKLGQLRELFFDLIEHLEELIRQQGETRDQTSAISGQDDQTRDGKLPGITSREDQHLAMAQAITDALAKQADAAGKAKGAAAPGQPSPADQAKTLSAAADEVRQAQTAMTDAKGALVKPQTATYQSWSLKPAVTAEGKAVDHLEAALRILQPPPKQNQKQKNQKQQKQPQGKQGQSKPKPQQQQAQPQGGASQRAADEDARRQRERLQHQREQDSKTEPVDKDW